MICGNIAHRKSVKPICHQYTDSVTQVQKKIFNGKDRQIPQDKEESRRDYMRKTERIKRGEKI